MRSTRHRKLNRYCQGNVLIPRPRQWRVWADLLRGHYVPFGHFEPLSLRALYVHYRHAEFVPGVCKRCMHRGFVSIPGPRFCPRCRTKGNQVTIVELWPYY